MCKNPLKDCMESLVAFLEKWAIEWHCLSGSEFAVSIAKSHLQREPLRLSTILNPVFRAHYNIGNSVCSDKFLTDDSLKIKI